MKKNIITALLFLVSLFMIDNCNAANTDYIIGSGEKINTATITSTGTTKIFKDTYKTDAGYIIEDNQYYRIKLNGKDALCIDHQKPYGFGDFYYAPKAVNNMAVRKIYAYATKGDTENFFAQILLWYLSDMGLLYEDNLVEEHGSIDFFTTVYNRLDDFTAYYMLTSLGAFMEYANYMDYQYDCEVIDNQKKYEMCLDIKSASTFRKKVQVVLVELGDSGVFNTIKGQVKGKIDAIKGGQAASVYLYTPSNAEKQSLISDNPNELNETCVSVLRAYSLKENGNVKSSQEAMNYLKKHFPMTFNEEDGTCGAPNDACYVNIIEPSTYTFPARVANRKAKVGARSSYTGTIKKIVGTYYACGGKKCKTELANKDKYKTCAAFKKAISDPANVEKCTDDGKKIIEVTCRPSTGSYKTCEEALVDYPGKGYDEQTFKEFVSKITISQEEKDKAVHLADGSFSCNKCQPTVIVDGAVCKEKEPSFFALKDATENGDGYTESKTCYQKGTAYKIDGQEKVGSKDENLGNSYCEVYCWESVGVNMPQSPQTSYGNKAGQLIWWGIDESNNIFAFLETRRICWTQPDYVKFNTAWYANEDKIAELYAKYLANEAYNADTDDSHVKEGSSCCVGGTSHKEGQSSEKCCYFVDKNHPQTGVYSGCTDGVSAADCAGNGDHFDGSDGHDVCDVDGHYYTKDAIEKSVTSSSGNTKKVSSDTKTSECVTEAPSASSFTVSNSTDDLTRAIGDRQSLRSTIEACQSISKQGLNEESMYKYTAKMSFTTDAPTVLNKFGISETEYYLVGNIAGQTVNVSQNIPSGPNKVYNCTTTSFDNHIKLCETEKSWDIPSYSEYTWDYNGVYNFSYSENFHFYAFKERMNLMSVLETDKIDPMAIDKKLYYDAGRGWPIAFEMYEGTYDISVSISDLGNNGHFDKILKQTDSKEKYGYDFLKGYYCPYPLINPLYCQPEGCPKCTNPPCPGGKDPDGLDIVYRLIDMGEGDNNKIFPGRDGKGRVLGSNWRVFANVETEKYKNITTSDIIYDATPMYSIELSPTTIGKIRSDNASYRKEKMDPYTSYRYTDNKIKITCDANSGASKTCVSGYITELIEKGVIKGTYAIKNESKRLDKLAGYKSCYASGTGHC